jgi:threonine dehydrogenase-like Zn-dependent dehydrogenase
VFCLFPHQTRYVVPAASVHRVPAEVPPRRAILAASLETALNGVWDAGILPGDRVAVIGGGAVGCLVAWLASGIAGCDVELVDVNPGRRAIAEALGTGFADPAGARRDADVVVHASGTSAGLATALRLAGVESVVLELSWYGAQQVSVPLGEAFHARRLTLKSSQVGRVAPAQRARWSHARRLGLALSLLAEPALDALITGECAFGDLPGVMPALADRDIDTVCHAVRYSHT